MTALLQQARAGEPLDIEIIDMHGHLGRHAFTIPNLTAESLIASMDALGIRAIVCSHMRSMSHNVEHANTEIHKYIQAFGGRILGYAAVFPADSQSVRQSVERWLAAGFTGLKLHNVSGLPYTEAAFEPAYVIANDRRLPVLFHTWGGQEELDHIRSVSERYRQASLLVAHAGSENEAAYIELAKDCPNVYLDLALSMAPRGLVERLVEAVGAEKVVWGSDSYFLNQAQQLGKVVGADIPEQAKAQILCGNARKILARAQQQPGTTAEG